MKPHTRQPQDDITERMAQECLAVRVRLLNRTLTAIYDEALHPLGMTTGQLNVMVVVAIGVKRPGPRWGRASIDSNSQESSFALFSKIFAKTSTMKRSEAWPNVSR